MTLPSNLTLAPQQREAYDKVGAWLKDTSPSCSQVFRLFGYAGTGKTTIARRLAMQCDGDVRSAAFTGKAASVLRKKGLAATTIHSMIYQVEEPDEELIASLKERIANAPSETLAKVIKQELATAQRPRFSLRNKESLDGVSLIVIDEVSMVNEAIGRDLESFGVKILVLGDPAQLPPVDGGGYFTARTPDVLLTEVHRQARDNPIIAMATLVRQGHRLRKGKYGDSECFDRRTENRDPFEYDQLIVGLNRTRKAWNERYRDRAGYGGDCPNAGEKVICLRNNAELGILNGTQWRVRDAEDVGYAYKLQLDDWDKEVKNEEEAFEDIVSKPQVSCEAHPFTLDLKEMDWYQRKQLEEFTWGYAITCHKAQGSEWPRVYIANESYAFRESQAQWLYTALTRASEKVTVAL
jgi:exodeoxyribonuclease-5